MNWKRRLFRIAVVLFIVGLDFLVLFAIIFFYRGKLVEWQRWLNEEPTLANHIKTTLFILLVVPIIAVVGVVNERLWSLVFRNFTDKPTAEQKQ